MPTNGPNCVVAAAALRQPSPKIPKIEELTMWVSQFRSPTRGLPLAPALQAKEAPPPTRADSHAASVAQLLLRSTTLLFPELVLI